MKIEARQLSFKISGCSLRLTRPARAKSTNACMNRLIEIVRATVQAGEDSSLVAHYVAYLATSTAGADRSRTSADLQACRLGCKIQWKLGGPRRTKTTTGPVRRQQK